MKLLFDSLDALLAELRERQVGVVRVARATHAETGSRTVGIAHLTSRAIVTAGIDDHLWAEWRHFIGRAAAEVGERGLQLPDWLKKKTDAVLADVSQCVDDAGFEIREGLLTHDTATMDTFRR
jgi:hypothetical protein